MWIRATEQYNGGRFRFTFIASATILIFLMDIDPSDKIKKERKEWNERGQIHGTRTTKTVGADKKKTAVVTSYGNKGNDNNNEQTHTNKRKNDNKNKLY